MSNPGKPIPKREATFLESDEEIKAAIAARLSSMQMPALGAATTPVATPPPMPASRPTPSPKAAPAKPLPNWMDKAAPAEVPTNQAMVFRPTRRPPMAMLCVLDDGGDDGAIHRLMQERYIIGRSEGDFKIPHDAMISTKHAELVRMPYKESWKWVLNDLGSTNGTYVRVGSGILRDGQEFLVGRSRYRFDAAKGDQTHAESAPNTGVTMSWQGSGAMTLLPSLVELTVQGDGRRILIASDEVWLGRDASCQVIPADDPFINPRHARVHKDIRGRWFIENNKSLNGVWVRVEQMPLEGHCQFLLGEQRFKLQVGSP